MTDAEAYSLAAVGSVALMTITTGLVTIIRGQSSKDVPIPPGAVESVHKLTESSHAIQIHLAGMEVEIDHMQKSLKAMAKQHEQDHMAIKLLRDIMIRWGKLDGLREHPERQTSDTETGEV